LVNPPNHAPLRFRFTVQTGVSANIGTISSSTTVFDPTAPASVSLLSILGRGLGEASGSDLEKSKQALRDAMILVGGSEAGVLDAYGNQLNGSLNGLGLVSLTDEGVNKLAERFQRGDSFGLAEMLMPLSLGFEWVDGPAPTLADWINTLQGELNDAWANPNNPENYLPLLLFNQNKRLDPLPPTLSPETRLNQMQAFMFMASFYSYAAVRTDPLYAGSGLREQSLWSIVSDLIVPAAYAQSPTNSNRRWTSYWKNVGAAQSAYIDLQAASALSSFAQMSAVMLTATAAGGMPGLTVSLPLVGLLEAEVISGILNIEQARRVPEPPKIVNTSILSGTDSNQFVFIRFRRSPSDVYIGGQRDGRIVYTLYRFGNFNEERELVTSKRDLSGDNELLMFDLSPRPGASFYALTCTRFPSLANDIPPGELSAATPWWNLPMAGINDPLVQALRSSRKVVSDYSEPALVNIGLPDALFQLSGLAVHSDGTVYLSDTDGPASEHRILKRTNLGEGPAVEFARSGFKDPGHQGLAIDRNGVLYTRNRASDGQFGGRFFRFSPNNGAREFTGSINYFSQLLMFANPVFGGPIAMGAPATPAISAEDLYVVDTIANQVKRVPVQAAYDAYRRVGQPYAAYPFDQQVIDIEVGHTGKVVLLAASAGVLAGTDLNIDVESSAGGFVNEEEEVGQGGLLSVFDPSPGVTNRALGLRLNYENDALGDNVRLWMELRSLPFSSGSLEVLMDGVPVLSGATGRIELAVSDFSRDFTVQAMQGGVVEVALLAEHRGSIFKEDKVRIHSAPGIPRRTGRHLFVNPKALFNTPPYTDVEERAAASLADALAIAAPNDTIFVIREHTQTVSAVQLEVPVNNLTIAGLAGRFLPPSSNTYGVVANYDHALPHPMILGDRSGRLMLVSERTDVTISGFEFRDGQTFSFGGAGIRVVAGNDVRIGQSKFINNRASGNGGAIEFVISPSGLVERCQFGTGTNLFNYATKGGALSFTDSSVLIRDSRFLRNVGAAGGGAVYAATLVDPQKKPTLVACEFIGNEGIGSFPAGGGAIFVEDSYADVFNSLFRSNSSPHGGAIATRGTTPLGSSGKVVVHNSWFIENIGDNGGGAVAMYGNVETAISFDYGYFGGSRMELYGCRLESNICVQSHGGAAIITAIGSSLKAHDCDFIGNRAPGSGSESDGGAVAAGSLAGRIQYSEFVRCRFERNYSGNGGGAIYHTTGGASIGSDLEFYENEGEKGGAIEGSEWSYFDYTNIIVGAVGRGNVARDAGGGIYIRGGTLKLTGDDETNLQIVGNRAVSRGGGIYLGKLITGFFILDPAIDITFSITRATISDNHTDGVGGAIYIASQNANTVFNEMTIDRCTIQRNTAASSVVTNFPTPLAAGIFFRQDDDTIQDASVFILKNSIVSDHEGAGLAFYNIPFLDIAFPPLFTELNVENTSFWNNDVGVFALNTDARKNIRDNRFNNQVNGPTKADVFLWDASTAQLAGNDFEGGSQRALRVLESVNVVAFNNDFMNYRSADGRVAISALEEQINAPQNYWGDAGGPDFPPLNVNPAGSFISATNVIYQPFLATPYD
jgi:predicted outer membrane repeat protein